MAGKITGIMIIEIAGRPAQHIKDALVAHVGQIKGLKYAKLINATYSEPRKIEGVEQEMYSCFAEVEVESLDFADMMNLVFDFMPSSFEIIEPSEVKMSLSDATSVLNTLSGRLHKYDEIAKVAQFQVQQLAQKFQEMQNNPSTAKEVKEEKTKKRRGKSKTARVK
jgi:hypothetical protein